MREILFRAKRKSDKEWIEGYVSEGTLRTEHRTYVGTVMFKKPRDVYDYSWCEVDPETVCQYTGLKDKNGKKIFEGDILSYTNEDGDTCYISVVFEKGAFLIDDHGIIEDDLLASHIGLGSEVVGNVFDNPELLEGDRND